jgi:hypothetical protein
MTHQPGPLHPTHRPQRCSWKLNTLNSTRCKWRLVTRSFTTGLEPWSSLLGTIVAFMLIEVPLVRPWHVLDSYIGALRVLIGAV